MTVHRLDTKAQPGSFGASTMPPPDVFSTHYDLVSRGFTMETRPEQRVAIRPNAKLTERDRWSLQRAQANHELWAIVRTYELMESWGKRPLTMRILAEASPDELYQFDMDGTSLQELRALRGASVAMERTCKHSNDQDAVHLWQVRTQLLDAEIGRRCAHDDWAEVPS